jgi:hypothetical protein
MPVSVNLLPVNQHRRHHHYHHLRRPDCWLSAGILLRPPAISRHQKNNSAIDLMLFSPIVTGATFRHFCLLALSMLSFVFMGSAVMPESSTISLARRHIYTRYVSSIWSTSASSSSSGISFGFSACGDRKKKVKLSSLASFGSTPVGQKPSSDRFPIMHVDCCFGMK